MNTPKILIIAAATVLFTFTGLAMAQEGKLPQITEDGLHLVPDSKLAVVYAEPGADLAGYKRINLLNPYVAFRKNWARDQRPSAGSRITTTSRDVEKIKNRLAEEFHEVFKQTLAEGGYDLVEESAADVLTVRPAIINLDVTAPDTPSAGQSRSYASSAGEMTLYIELYDSVTGDLIAKALDRRADGSRGGYYTWTNSVSNRVAAERILKGWAEILRDALDEAKK